MLVDILCRPLNITSQPEIAAHIYLLVDRLIGRQTDIVMAFQLYKIAYNRVSFDMHYVHLKVILEYPSSSNSEKSHNRRIKQPSCSSGAAGFRPLAWTNTIKWGDL